MTYAMLAAAGLGIALGSGALAGEPTTVDALPNLEIAPGSAVQPLGTMRARKPVFVLMHREAASSTDVAAPAPTREPLAFGTSGLLAFGTGGVRLPAYEADIPTGTVTARPIGRR